MYVEIISMHVNSDGRERCVYGVCSCGALCCVMFLYW